MSGFSADWLALRAGADTRARNGRVADAVTTAFAGRRGLTVVDIGTGTGANLLNTAPLLPRPQHWLMVDHDPALLARVKAPEGVTVETRVADLSGGVRALLDPAPDLVTASAFFDLVGADWLDGFVAALVEARSSLYAALTYDGVEAWDGRREADADVLAAFHADQRRDKGFGPALGPEAHAALAGRLAAAGYRVTEGRSDWRLEAPRDQALISALAEGTAAAAERAVGPAARDWASARRRSASVVIGHRDLLALPSAR